MERAEDRVPEKSPPGSRLEISDGGQREPAPIEGVLEPRKRHRAPGDVIETYVPKWDVLSSYSVAHAAPEPAKEVGPDLYRGMMLLADAPLYAGTDAVEACTQLMALMSMVCVVPLSLFHVELNFLLCIVF